MKKKTRMNPLVTHFTFASIALAMLWMFVQDKDTLLTGSALVLAYIACALGYRMIAAREALKNTSKAAHKKH
ncbi:hypothetical protein AC626_03355 [Pseudoalteromonas rubra]|uniref:Uncharacterized protein n=2 Tax=Pseudoalteromonas rubra TaxID=43658 RepID=A0A0L0EXZ2_9GAMM|nr:hypothetical protein AC626_03355 [Pseudoalteromonas rubra]